MSEDFEEWNRNHYESCYGRDGGDTYLRARKLGNHRIAIQLKSTNSDQNLLLPTGQALALARWIIENVNDGEKE